MPDKDFPSLAELGRPNAIMDTVTSHCVPQGGGIIIVSGIRGTGISTTITALGHELKHRNLNVINIGLLDHEVFPGLDSIFAPDTNSIKEYLLNQTTPDVVLFDYSYSIEVLRLAVSLADAGSLVILGMITDSPEDAVDRLVKSIAMNRDVQETVRKLITLTIHQSNTIATYNAYSQQDRNLLTHSDEALALLAECNPQRYYGKNGGMFQLQFTVKAYN